MDLHTRAGERIGTLDVHMAQRLRKLFEGGNEYEFTVAKLSTVAIAVLVAETKLSANMTKVVSFPPSLQKTAADFDLDDDLMEDTGDDLEMMEHEDDETITPEAERSERIKSIMSGRLGGAYGMENEGLSI